MGVVQAHRYHDICAGHRVAGQGGKCEHLHGHNYRVHFTVEGACDAAMIDKDTAITTGLDSVGRVLDFSDIKSRLCMWLEDNWDHKMLMWKDDLLSAHVKDIDPSCVIVPFNPTAENMAQYLVETIGPQQLEGTSVVLVEVKIEETAKCFATYKKA
jgi:6-pyruvoyltetrahydropterin/6-carboxytetrahydropterin synthase